MKNLFGEEIINEDFIRLTYKGESFVNGQIQIKLLYQELQSLERVIRNSVNILVQSGKLEAGFKNVEIYIQIGEGSIPQKVKIVFGAAFMAPFAATLIAGLLNTTYEHFLNKYDNDAKYAQEIAHIEGDKQFKQDLKNIIMPICREGDSITIQDNHGTINLNIDYPKKQSIANSLEQEDKEDPLLKNGEFEEILVGVIRKIDLDALGGNYFGFTIDNGFSKVSTSLEGEFHLNDIKEIINTRISVNAKVKYRNNEIKHIHVINYKILEKQEDLFKSNSPDSEEFLQKD